MQYMRNVGTQPSITNEGSQWSDQDILVARGLIVQETQRKELNHWQGSTT